MDELRRADNAGSMFRLNLKCNLKDAFFVSRELKMIKFKIKF